MDVDMFRWICMDESVMLTYNIPEMWNNGYDIYSRNAEMEKKEAVIRFDREFPESARILMLKGTKVILVPNACFMEISRRKFSCFIGFGNAAPVSKNRGAWQCISTSG